MTARRKKAAPIALRWQKALQDDELPREYPGRGQIVSVAAVLVRHADADGTDCRPAIETIARLAGAGDKTVRLVLAWLVDNGWLAVTAKAKPRRPTVYRLTFPKVVEEPPWDDAQGWSSNHPSDDPKVVPKVVEEPPDLPPPTVREEEEEAPTAPGADAPAPAPTFPAPVLECIREVAKRTNINLEIPVLGPEIARLIELWSSPTVVAVYAVEKLKANRGRMRNPSAFLAADLTHRRGGDLAGSPRMKLASLLDKLTDGTAFDADDWFISEVEARGLGPADDCPDAWNVKPANLDAVCILAQEAMRRFPPADRVGAA